MGGGCAERVRLVEKEGGSVEERDNASREGGMGGTRKGMGHKRQGDKRDMLSHRCCRCHCCHCHCSCVTLLLSLLLLLSHSSCPLVHMRVLDQGRVQGGHLASPGTPQPLVSTYNEEQLRTHLGGPPTSVKKNLSYSYLFPSYPQNKRNKM